MPQSRIIYRHLVPNALSPILIAISFGIPAAMLGEAGLSFLGLGVKDPIASWGKMVGVGNAYVRVYWHLALFPTLALALSMLGFSFMGDGLRDALDPKLIVMRKKNPQISQISQIFILGLTQNLRDPP